MTIAVVEAGAAGALTALAVVELTAIVARHGAGAGPLVQMANAVRRVAPGLTGPQRLRSRAAMAGLSLSADDLYSVKAGAALCAALLGLPLIAWWGVRPGVLLLASLAALAFMAPDAILRRRIGHRREQIALELPVILDLLEVSLSAGMPIAVALERIAARHGGTLGEELRRTQQAISAGEPRAEALAKLSRRCPHEGVAALVAAIDRSDRHGVPLAPALATIAGDARRQRARAAQERAARAAPQIQLVIALGLVPATMLIVAAGLIGAL